MLRSILITVLLSFGTNAFSEIASQWTEQRFVERVNAVVPTWPISAEYLFNREGYCSNCGQIIELSQHTFDKLYAMRPMDIDFNIYALVPFDEHGTCSAMALDFLARYKTECEGLATKEERMFNIEQFKDYYRMDNETFKSRQAAYNTILVNPEIAKVDPELIKEKKMQALANYHHLMLEPATPSIDLDKVENQEINLANIVDLLPMGTYVVRMHIPIENHKWEDFGHTMIFIKNSVLSIFYDNASGAKVLDNFNIGEEVEDILLNWHFPEVRLYRATCGHEGCINLSAQKIEDCLF